jgi:DNA polymerase elongation subunit (family B)
MELYLFSVQAISICSDKWAKKPLLFFVDTTGKRHTYILADYIPYVLVRCQDENIEVPDLDTHLAECTSVAHVVEHMMTPLVGFTNNRQDRVFRVYYSDLGEKYRIIKKLEELAVTILHKRISDESHLLHTTGWKLQSWYRMSGKPRLSSFVDNGLSGSIRTRDLLITKHAVMPIPPLSYVYIRLTIKSSTATPSNLFCPDHTLAHDVIQSCELRLGRLDLTASPITFQIDRMNEMDLLREIQRWFITHSPCIIVHMSDPVDHLAYLHFRAKRNKRPSGMSSIRAINCVEHTNMNDKSFRDLSCPGRETMDLLHVLQKFMISPNLDGYTLPDAFNHPKLIRSKDTLAYNGEEDVMLSPLPIRRAFISKELEVMCALQNDNAFIVNNLALSASCDLSLFNIISRGQQARAFACFARAYHNEGIYINHTQFEQPYLLVKKKRADSSFPDPTWIVNPPLAALRVDPTTVLVSNPVPPKKRRISVMELFGRKVSAPTVAKTEKRFGGGFVIAPDPGFYHRAWEAVSTLDFASLYPSIMQGYRICFMRVCYDQRWLEDDRAEKEYVPLDDNTCCVFIKSYDGVSVRSSTDRIVENVMQNRKRVRAEMKRTQDAFVKQSLDAQQLCCKILQNAFYGACGSETFAIPCTAVAASVCMIGQWMNKTVRHQAMLRGGRCVYGDTDSVMIQFPTSTILTSREDILRDIYRQAHELEAVTTKMFPPPNAVEFETLKLPHLQTTKKKTYAAHEYPPHAEGWNAPFTELYKGFAFKKRDRCAFVYRIGKTMMTHMLANTLSDGAIVQWLSSTIDTTFLLRPNEEQLSDFIITCRLGTDYKSENVLGLHLADQYELETGSRPSGGRRLRFVIVPSDKKHFQSSVTPATFLRNNHELDAAYYLQTQLLLPLKQVLDLRPGLYLKIERMVHRKVEQATIKSTPIWKHLPFE